MTVNMLLSERSQSGKAPCYLINSDLLEKDKYGDKDLWLRVVGEQKGEMNRLSTEDF